MKPNVFRRAGTWISRRVFRQKRRFALQRVLYAARWLAHWRKEQLYGSNEVSAGQIPMAIDSLIEALEAYESEGGITDMTADELRMLRSIKAYPWQRGS